MWSVPPAEPPAQDTAPGSAFNLVVRSASDSNSEAAGTTITSYSPRQASNGGDGVELDWRVVGQDGANHDIAADQEPGWVTVCLLGELRQPYRAAERRER